VRQYAKCEKDGATLWFRTDFIGRVTAVCPTCDEGHPPPPKPGAPGIPEWEVDLAIPRRSCDFCGETFTPRVANQKYCSKPCVDSVEAERARKIALGRRTEIPERRCAGVGCTTRFRPRTTLQKYCSSACRERGPRDTPIQKACRTRALNRMIQG